jgi:hypothetical protein
LNSILAFKSAIKSETLRNEGRPPFRASCVAAVVAALEAMKGLAISEQQVPALGLAQNRDDNS